MIINKKRHSLNERENLKILTVKAVEEFGDNILNPLTISKANILAISAKNDREFILKRADYLFSLLPETLKATVNVPAYKKKVQWVIFWLALIIGIFSNYLGAEKFIHIIYNPLTILLGWNLLVYTFIIISHFFKFNFKRKNSGSEKEDTTDNETEEPYDIDTDIDTPRPNFIIRWLSGWLFKRAIILKAKYDDKKTKLIFVKNIITPLWHEYFNISGKAFVYRFETILHIGAIGLTIGALAGIYFRGLFFKYNMIWQSTFISDLSTVKIILNILFGPAHFILHGNFIGINEVHKLLDSQGAAAAPWIHVMAVTTIIYVVIPRLLLALYYNYKEKRAFREIDFSVPYFKDHILKNRKSIVEAVKSGITEIITKRINIVALKISEFVVEDYFDKIIIPILLDYRKKGGKIKDLENDLNKTQEKFEPILVNYLMEIEEEFQENILAEINLFLGRNFDFEINTESPYHPKSNNDINKQLPDKMASEISDTISGTVVTTMAITVGSLTGGIGKSLGTAILTTMFGVSGPVGLLIGGVATAITLGGFYKFNKEKITNYVKEIPVPPVVVNVSLSDKKIAKTREETHEYIKNEIIKTLEPKIEEVTENILKEIIH